MATRTLILVRHGQYHTDRDDDRYGQLTPLGVKQVTRVAKRLAELPIDLIHVSTMQRARATAKLIGAMLPDVPQRHTQLLWEGFPTAIKGLTREQRQWVPVHRARMERAFSRYFRPAGSRDRMELLVCHGNVIRFLMRRALDDPPHKWLRGDVMHTGLCMVAIRTNGRTILLGFNDVGHLPRSLQSSV
jgi:serine/threonine-protein phosphatase PGAM5